MYAHFFVTQGWLIIRFPHMHLLFYKEEMWTISPILKRVIRNTCCTSKEKYASLHAGKNSRPQQKSAKSTTVKKKLEKHIMPTVKS
jgi:hypothetical protein